MFAILFFHHIQIFPCVSSQIIPAALLTDNLAPNQTTALEQCRAVWGPDGHSVLLTGDSDRLPSPSLVLQ